MPPDIVLAAAAQVTSALEEVANGQLIAAYLHGSAVLGGWTPGSDVDMLFVLADGAAATGCLDAVGQVLADARFPGRGLECSAVAASQAADPGPPWPFLLHVTTSEASGPRIVPGAGQVGDRDLLMHYVVCRAAGHAVCGPPPEQLIGAVPRPAILGYLADELDWGLAHATEPYAVLNACRALAYRSDGEIISKMAGGETALRRGLGPGALITRALEQQAGRHEPQPPAPDAVTFVRATAVALRSAAADGGAD